LHNASELSWNLSLSFFTRILTLPQVEHFIRWAALVDRWIIVQVLFSIHSLVNYWGQVSISCLDGSHIPRILLSLLFCRTSSESWRWRQGGYRWSSTFLSTTAMFSPAHQG
jgi:hypothetical protein